MQLNNEQLEAVKHGKSPLLILAGAGTGKTTTILDRIQYVANSTSIAPESILALTFSVEATDNLKNKLLDKNIVDGNLINVSNFHSFAKNIIEDNYIQLGYSSIPVVIDKDDLVYLFTKKIYSFNKFKSRRYNRFPIKAIKSILSIHDQLCQELISDKKMFQIKKKCLDCISLLDGEEDEIYRQIVDSIDTFKDFRKIKKESGFIEYEDMIYDVWNLLNINSDFLLELQSRYKFIIIDEFQDNNYAFSEILNKIAVNHQNITIVGDDDQSIYSFRGANSYNMHEFDRLYSKNKNYKRVELVKNYRSRQEILDIANSVIANNSNRMEKKPLSANLNTGSGAVELHVGDLNSQLSHIVNNIRNLLDKSSGTIAVLCRTHSDCISVSNALDQEKIDHGYNSSKLFDKKIVKDMVAIINIAAESKYSLHSIIRLSRNLFSDNSIKKIIDIEKNKRNILEACISNKNHFNSIEYSWLSRLQLLVHKSSYIDSFVDNMAEFINKNNHSEFDKYLIMQVKDVFKRFNSFYKSYDIKNLCNYINLMMDNNNIVIDEPNAIDSSVVNLMTVHNSKGMEFDTVFLPFLQSSKFPQANRKAEFATSIPLEFKNWNIEGLDEKTCHIEEERRLFYVAVTRAKEKLYLLSTEKRQSKFLGEIHNHLYNIKMIPENIIVDNQQSVYSEVYNGKISNKEGLLNLSSSKISNYDKCQLSYKYASLDLIPGFQNNSIFALGNIVHKVLQEFHESNLKSRDDLIQILDKYWDDKMYSYDCESHQYYEDAKNMFSNYIKYLDDNPPSPILFEHYFKINIKNCILSGVIDRVDIDPSGRLIIYDYKTSKTQKKPAQLKKSFQLPIYALAIYCNGSEMHPEISSNYESLLAGELSLRFENIEQIVEFSESEIKEFENAINVLAEDISSGVFVANPGFMSCMYCDYRKFICSYYD